MKQLPENTPDRKSTGVPALLMRLEKYVDQSGEEVREYAGLPWYVKLFRYPPGGNSTAYIKAYYDWSFIMSVAAPEDLQSYMSMRKQ